jgi:epoxyqueuosine reductase QueG
MSQDVRPWNVRFAQALKEPAFRVRAALGTAEGLTDARTLARELLAMSQPEFSAAFKGSPMKRAKRRGPARNAVVALGIVGTADDIPVLEAAHARRAAGARARGLGAPSPALSRSSAATTRDRGS